MWPAPAPVLQVSVVHGQYFPDRLRRGTPPGDDVGVGVGLGGLRLCRHGFFWKQYLAPAAPRSQRSENLSWVEQAKVSTDKQATDDFRRRSGSQVALCLVGWLPTHGEIKTQIPQAV
jgi:hypothetical protein